MGLGSWIEDRAKDVAHGVENVGHAVARGVELNFSDGSRPPGQDPAQIYGWFHNGPGTGSYKGAQGNLQGLTSSYSSAADDVDAAHKALANGAWKGTAAQSAQAAVAPMKSNFQSMHTVASGSHEGVSGQIDSFGTTKSKVIQVPNDPPKGGGLAALTSPISMAKGVGADMAVAQYQAGTQANQAAYGGYQGQTTPQAGQLQNQQPAPPAAKKPSADVQQGTVDQSSTPHSATPSVNSGATSPAGSGGSGAAGSGGGWQAPGGGHAPAGGSGGYASSPTAPGRHSQTPNVPGGVPSGTSAQNVTPGAPGSVPGGGQPGGASGAGSAGWRSRSGRSMDAGEMGAMGSGALATGLGSGALASGGSTGSGGYGSRAGLRGGGTAGLGADGESAGARGGQGAGGARSGAGAMSAAEEAAAARSGSAAAGGRAGAAGAPGMAGGRGAKGEEDKEHKSASYLQQNRESELIGDLPKTVPPVIGE